MSKEYKDLRWVRINKTDYNKKGPAGDVIAEALNYGETGEYMEEVIGVIRYGDPDKLDRDLAAHNEVAIYGVIFQDDAPRVCGGCCACIETPF